MSRILPCIQTKLPEKLSGCSLLLTVIRLFFCYPASEARFHPLYHSNEDLIEEMNIKQLFCKFLVPSCRFVGSWRSRSCLSYVVSWTGCGRTLRCPSGLGFRWKTSMRTYSVWSASGCQRRCVLCMARALRDRLINCRFLRLSFVYPQRVESAITQSIFPVT